MRMPMLALLVAAVPAAQAGTLRLHGYAYDLQSGAHRYTEVHEQQTDGDRWVGGTITYLAPDGSVLGRKTLDFSADPFIPLYRLELAGGSGFVEGISMIARDSLTLFRKRYQDAALTEEKVSRPEGATADSGFHNLVRDRFAQLMAGEKIQFHFAVATELDTFKFRGQRIEDTTFEGRPAVRFRVQPDTLLRLLVDPLELTYDPGTRRLLEYRGISNLHDPATRAAYAVRIVYPSAPPAEAATLPAEYR